MTVVLLGSKIIGDFNFLYFYLYFHDDIFIILIMRNNLQ